jgi:Outer membrane protein beta-barrel domain
MKSHASNSASAFRAWRFLFGIALLISLAFIARSASGAELIPSIGATQSMDDHSGDAKLQLGLALRAPILPVLQSEIGVAYRQNSYAGGDLTERMWPVTASLWLTPIPTLYLGGGVGWYQTSYSYSGILPFEDKTQQQFGMHLGGGLAIPLAPNLGLDLNGRYVFMQSSTNPLPPASFNPDFWTTTLGLSFKL